MADVGAAVLGIPLGFGLAYFFTDQIKAIMTDVHRAERWLGLAGLLALAAIVVVGVWRWESARREGASGRGTGRETFPAAVTPQAETLPSRILLLQRDRPPLGVYKTACQ